MEELIARFKALPDGDQVWLLSFLRNLQAHPGEVSAFLDNIHTEEGSTNDER